MWRRSRNRNKPHDPKNPPIIWNISPILNKCFCSKGFNDTLIAEIEGFIFLCSTPKAHYEYHDNNTKQYGDGMMARYTSHSYSFSADFGDCEIHTLFRGEKNGKHTVVHSTKLASELLDIQEGGLKIALRTITQKDDNSSDCLETVHSKSLHQAATPWGDSDDDFFDFCFNEEPQTDFMPAKATHSDKVFDSKLDLINHNHLFHIRFFEKVETSGEDRSTERLRCFVMGTTILLFAHGNSECISKRDDYNEWNHVRCYACPLTDKLIQDLNSALANLLDHIAESPKNMKYKSPLNLLQKYIGKEHWQLELIYDLKTEYHRDGF